MILRLHLAARPQGGGAFVAQSPLGCTLTTIVFAGNLAAGGGGGAAAMVASPLAVDDCHFMGNRAEVAANPPLQTQRCEPAGANSTLQTRRCKPDAANPTLQTQPHATRPARTHLRDAARYQGYIRNAYAPFRPRWLALLVAPRTRRTSFAGTDNRLLRRSVARVCTRPLSGCTATRGILC